MRTRKLVLLAAVLIAAIAALWLWKGRTSHQIAPDSAGTSGPTSAAHPAPTVDSPSPRSDPRALPPSPAPKTNVSGRPRSRSEWAREFRDRRDVVQLVQDAAKAAEAGDDGAAQEMFEIAVRCAGLVNAIRGGVTAQEFRARTPVPDPEYLEFRTEEFEYCEPLARAPELAGWQTRDGKFSASYWREIAERLGNPTALTSRFTRNAFAMPRTEDAAREALLAQIRADVKTILRSGDGEGWYQLGMQTSVNLFSTDTTAGLALALASCDLGYDCTKNNRRNFWGRCTVSACTPSDDLAQWFSDYFPSSQTGPAYAKLLELKELMHQQNWDAIEQFVKPDGRLMQPGYREPDSSYAP